MPAWAVAAARWAASKTAQAGRWLATRPVTGKKSVRDAAGNKLRDAAGKKITTPVHGTRGIWKASGGVLDRAWQAESFIQSIRNVSKEWLPQTVLSVTVKVAGSPQSNMSNLFYLACAVAANANPDVLGGARAHIFTATIVPHSKVVVVAIAHSAGGLFGGGGMAGRTAVKGLVPDSYYANQVWPVLLSNKPETNNGTTVSPEPLGTVQAITNSQFNTNGFAPVIATTLSASNPVPQLDQISRQSDITQLVA